MKRPTLHILRFTLFVLLLTSCSAPTTSGADMAQANRLYEAGRYAEAAAAYQALVDTGVRDGRLYYNLGNAYYKSGDLGWAVLNYRRAQRLRPRDADIAANLALARAQTLDRIEAGESGIIAFLRRAVGWLTPDEAAALTLLAWVLLCGLVVATILLPRYRRALRYGIIAVAVLLFLSGATAGIKWFDAHGRPPAIVVADEVAVRSGPGEDYVSSFALHAGAEVRIVERRGDWVRIALPGDLQGWTPAPAVEALFSD